MGTDHRDHAVKVPQCCLPLDLAERVVYDDKQSLAQTGKIPYNKAVYIVCK